MRRETVNGLLMASPFLIPLGLILAAPVMREKPAPSPTPHTEQICHIDIEQIEGEAVEVEKCNEERID